MGVGCVFREVTVAELGGGGNGVVSGGWWGGGVVGPGGRAAALLGSCVRGNDESGRPFDGLRANGFPKRAYGALEELGMRRWLVVGAAPLDTGFRRYDGGGCDSRYGWLVAEGEVPAAAGRAPSCVFRTSFESLRVIGIAKRRYGGWGELGRRRGFGSSQANEQCSVPNGLHVIA